MPQRLDAAVHERGIAESRQRAQNYIIQGKIKVNGKVVTKPGTKVSPTDLIEAELPKVEYASRGGHKLAHALQQFQFSPEGLTVMDAGASNGGFTDCLLKNGAKKIFAVDVGKGQLDCRLSGDPKVTVIDNCNIRYMKKGDLDETPSLVTADLSFISLTKVLPVFYELLSDTGAVIALVKPQFEAGRGKTQKGVVRDPEIQIEVLQNIEKFATELKFYPAELTYSPIKGASGNIEFLILLKKEITENRCDPTAVVSQAHKILD